MKNTKKFISVILALILTVGCFALAVSAETTASENDISTQNPSVSGTLGYKYTLNGGKLSNPVYVLTLNVSEEYLLEIENAIENGRINFAADAFACGSFGDTAEPFISPERYKTETFGFYITVGPEDNVMYTALITVSGTYSKSDNTTVISSVTVEESGEMYLVMDYSIDMSQRTQGKASVTFTHVSLGDFARFDYTLATNGNISCRETNLMN